VLEEVDLDHSLSKAEYQRVFPDLQERLRRLQYSLLEAEIPTVVVFEGWDASGKGTVIQRLTERLDPRAFRVHPGSPPSELEQRYHFLWRHQLRLPEDGHMVLFDHSWYGRVLVDRVEKWVERSAWSKAYGQINEDKAVHIITIEDPIEYLHPHNKSTVNQREVGNDTQTFALALRAALRQAPKVILVGEMRDVETISIALEASETGHLVLSTLHTIDASKTIDRIVGVFPKNEERQVRTRFSQAFRWVVSQRLIPKEGGGRMAICEILRSNSRTKEYVQEGEREGKSLADAMADGALDGMQTFDGELERLIGEGKLDRETALSYATNRTNLQLRLETQGSDVGKGAAPIGLKGAPRPPARPAHQPSELDDLIER